MALNQHERDVINALILRVNDLVWENASLRAQLEHAIRSVPFKKLRRRMGMELWPELRSYEELKLFVDTAPEVRNIDDGPNNRRKNTTNIPGYFERKPKSPESLFIDSDDDSRFGTTDE